MPSSTSGRVSPSSSLQTCRLPARGRSSLGCFMIHACRCSERTWSCSGSSLRSTRLSGLRRFARPIGGPGTRFRSAGISTGRPSRRHRASTPLSSTSSVGRSHKYRSSCTRCTGASSPAHSRALDPFEWPFGQRSQACSSNGSHRLSASPQTLARGSSMPNNGRASLYSPTRLVAFDRESFASRVLVRRLGPPEGTPLGSLPEPFAAHRAARQYLGNGYAIPTSRAGELTFRQCTSRPELHVFVVSGRP